MLGIIETILFLGAIAFVSYPFVKPKLVDHDEKYCPDCEDEMMGSPKYCSTCGTETITKTIEAEWSDGLRNTIAQEITPDETEVITEEEKKESYEEVYQIN